MTQTTDAKPERDQRSDLKLAVFGATGGIGQSLVRRAIQAGHRVRVLVRNADKFKAWAAEQAWTDEDRARLQVETGDATDVGDVQRVVRGVDAVLCSLGAPATSRSRVRSRGTATILSAMEKEGVNRIVAVSVFGANETRKELPFFLRYVIFPFYLRRVVRDHEAQEKALSASSTEWTAVRPPNLKDDPSPGGVVHGVGPLTEFSTVVSRGEVADFMLEEVNRRQYVKQSPSICGRRAVA